MLELYHAIKNADSNHRNMVLTVLDGKPFGEKALVSGERIKWESVKNGFFSENRAEIGRIKESGKVIVGGRTVFSEILGKEKKMVICGGGHVSVPVIQMGIMLGFHVTVLEDRPQFADNARRAGASRVYCEPFKEGLSRIEGDEDTYFIIVTRGHRYDQTCLAQIAGKKHAYIGMIGSRKRVKLVKEAVIAEGVCREVIDRVYTPIGLAIGAETPEEIAVAIMAEIIEVKNKNRRDSGYTREIMQVVCEKNASVDGKECGCAENTGVMVTIVGRKGSAPRKMGTKMLVLPDGHCVGTIGGGCAEADIYRKALLKIRRMDTEPELCRVDMTGEEAEEEGMVCGGVIEVLMEML